MSYPKPKKPAPPSDIPEWLMKIIAALAALAELGREWLKRIKRREPK